MCATMLTTMTARDKASGSKHPVNTSFIQVALVIVCFLTAIRQWLEQKFLLFSFVFSKNPFIYNLAYPSLFSFPLISFLIGNGLIIPFYKKIMIVTPISLKLIVTFLLRSLWILPPFLLFLLKLSQVLYESFLLLLILYCPGQKEHLLDWKCSILLSSLKQTNNFTVEYMKIIL